MKTRLPLWQSLLGWHRAGAFLSTYGYYYRCGYDLVTWHYCRVHVVFYSLNKEQLTWGNAEQSSTFKKHTSVTKILKMKVIFIFKHHFQCIHLQCISLQNLLDHIFVHIYTSHIFTIYLYCTYNLFLPLQLLSNRRIQTLLMANSVSH